MGCMSAKGLEQRCFIESTVNASRYINILENCLVPSVPSFVTFDKTSFKMFSFQDGAAAHTCFRVAIVRSILETFILFFSPISTKFCYL